MDIESIKNKVNNYESCSIDDIEEILNFIVERKKQELGIDFEFETIYDEGGHVKPDRTPNGLQQVEIGYANIAEMKDNKEMKRHAELGQIEIETEIPEVLPTEERKEFIELILATFHELRHVKQNDNIQDHPVSNEETRKMTREIIINKSFTGFRNAYNYEQSMIEIDAMKTSLEETVDFFKKMGTDITPDEIFAVMKEKELSHLGYNLQEFGDSYETAISHFNQIYGKTTDIRGIPDIIKSLPDDKKEILYGECQDLLDRYYSETDMDKKMDLLEEMSLRMTPELREQYPLVDNQTEKNEETGYILSTVNGKNISEIGNKTTNFQVGTHDNNIYQYTDAVQSIQSNAFNEYCEYLVANDMDMTEEGQKEFIGKAMGKKYAELFEGTDEKQLAEIFGRLDYSSLYDTQMNYDEWTNTKVKSLLGLQKVQGADGSEIFVAQYEQSMEDGEPYEMVSEYYSLDEKGNLVQQEAPQIQESGKSVVMTQKSIADKLGQRSQDRVANSEQPQTSSTETKESGILDRGGKVTKPFFDQALLSAGFRPEAITGLKSSIQMVSPRALLTMDNILGRAKEQTLSKGEIEDGNEQDYR